DWLLRFYGFSSEELFDGTEGRLHPYLDPKCHWALIHKEIFPLEVNRAPYELLLRVPGVGVKSAWRITRARRAAALTWDALAKIGVVTKRARHFLLANGKRCFDTPAAKEEMLLDLMSLRERALFRTETAPIRQLSLFDEETPTLSPAERKELSCLAAPM
ncbi:MAG: biotin synthase, partial [Schwartzia sp.]|nr:biotin synthase [Schwartzia sp. (in: firmicutes)]